MNFRTMTFLMLLVTVTLGGRIEVAFGAEQGKLDPYFEASSPVSAASVGGKAQVTGSASTAPRFVSAFLRVRDVDQAMQAIERLGGKVRAVVGDIVTATIPADALGEISRSESIEYIEAAKPITVSNNVATNEINADEVHEGLGFSAPVTGKGVIIGVVDTGIDLGHPDFLDAEGKSRILAVWDQRDDTGPTPAEIPNSYGTECTKDNIDSGTCPMLDEEGHGTHIAGTASGRNEEYGGIAPDASIIAVRYRSELEINDGYADTLFSTTICEGAYYIFKKAETLGMPAVVNLSLGTHIGAHDGTSLFEQCLDGLAGPGRIIVAAAGNETSLDDYYTGVHFGGDITGKQAANFVIRSAQDHRLFYIDLWGRTGETFKIGLALHEGKPESDSLREQSSMVALGTSTSGKFLGTAISYKINAHESANTLNNKPHVGIAISLASSVMKPEDYSFDVVIEGQAHVDAWAYPDKPATTINFTALEGDQGQAWDYLPGDRTMSVAMPATAERVIAVGAYTTRNEWDLSRNCCEVDFSLGDLLPFSSRGPTADPARLGIKPEIAAPGAMIASARSRAAVFESALVMSDGDHVLQAGTSMAAPFVTGTAALMLELSPGLSEVDVERYLTESAYVDAHVGDVPNDVWGYGKLDVLGAVQLAANGGTSGTVQQPSLSAPSDKLASGCTMIAQESHRDVTMIILMMFSPLLVFGRWRWE
ncbi:MAG: S8 family serine peptidase [Deltaproteobacteria bacterium]|nr:S8 family serine peptidase [Deltaproteobacteria bacterium]